MMSNIFNIETVRGDTWNGFQSTVVDCGSALDLTNAVIRMQLRKEAEDACYALEFSTLSTVKNTITITTPLSGQFKVDPVIIEITPRSYVYSCKVFTQDGTAITILKGNFVVTQDITR